MGLAVGDALGTTLEFQKPGSFTPITDIIGGGPFNLRPGEWTDDTSLALCLAESLIENGWDKRAQLDRYVRWMEEGYLASNGRCFDIGYTTSYSLDRYKRTGLSDTDRIQDTSAGNGSLMRLAPVPMYYARDPVNAVEKSGESSKTTHGAPAAVDACRYMGGLIYGALNGEPKRHLLSVKYAPVPGYWIDNHLNPGIDEIACGSYKEKNPPDIKGTGHVVRALEAALWAFYNSETYREGLLMAVNLGDDADTTGAIFGQLAGAYYGLEKIPRKWRAKIAKRDLLLEYSKNLHNCALNQ